MSKEAELQKIKAALLELSPNLYSSDKKSVEKAQAELKKVGSDMKEWASKYGVKLAPHTEEGPDATRKCVPVIYPIIHGKLHECILLGKEGRNCLYSCTPGTFQPT